MKTAKKHYKIDTIINNLINGNLSDAKQLTQHRCKTIPERQAYKVGQVVGALMDKEHSRYNPDLAVTYLNLFD